MTEETKLAYTPELIAEVTAEFKAKYAEVLEQREEILKAFIAKYKCEPDEIVQIEQRPEAGTMLWFVVRKSDCIFCSKCQAVMAEGRK